MLDEIFIIWKLIYLYSHICSQNFDIVKYQVQKGLRTAAAATILVLIAA